MNTLKKLQDQLLFETKQSNSYRLKRNNASTQKDKKAWQILINLSDKSKNELRKKINLIKNKSTMRTEKKATPAQLAARKKFAAMAKDGTLAKKRAQANNNQINAGKTAFESKKRVELKLKLKAFGYSRLVTRDLSTRELETLLKKQQGLKKPATKGLTTLCAKTVGVTGRRKKDGTQKKGYVATKGGTLKKKVTVKKK